MQNNPENTGLNDGTMERRRFLEYILIASAIPACKKMESGISAITPSPNEEQIKEKLISINGRAIKISDINKLKRPLKDIQRMTEYPMSDEARRIINEMTQDEGFSKIEDYNSSSGKPLILKKTAAELYKLAQIYASMEGYGLAAFSAFRSPSDQDDLYNGSGRKDKKTKVAKSEDSQHPRGGAIDVLLYKKIEDRTITLTPDKANPKRGTAADIARLHKYLQLAGFVNYTEESWHNEMGSEEWGQIMSQAGISRGKNMLYMPTENPNYKFVK